MKITVLVDNNTIIDRYLLGEPGISFLIQESDKNLLFDVGYSDAFIVNAQKLNINMFDIDYIGISHGHIDHTWGLIPLIKMYSEAVIEKINFRKPTLLAHPNAFAKKFYKEEIIGSLADKNTLRDYFVINLSAKPFWITENLVFLGEIERSNDFENKIPIGKCIEQGVEKDDFLFDDTALAYKSQKGLVIITGCSHSGICNIIEYAKKVCNEDRLVDIIGGLHLLNPDKEQIERTKAYLKEADVGQLHACHCTDFYSKMALSEVTEIKEVGSGLVLEFD
jgi:7,8-dihydropterin-6-yl-methyl-4-(beta-D-ribofuranosyl)aminobenzene 5'-phosphate synthase